MRGPLALPPRSPSPARRCRRARAASLLLAAALAGCGVAPTRASGGVGSGPDPEGTAPAWVGAPMQDGTLESIERWLDQNPRASAHWRNEALLKLAEGRVARSAGAASTQASGQLGRAAAEFQAVLDDGQASTTQRRRAERGLVTVNGGTRTPVAPPPATGGVVTRAQWGALPPRTTELTRHRGAYTWITVHHSAMDGGDGSMQSSIDAVKRIQRDHVTNRGYGDIGYHYLIDPAGRVFEGRSLDWQGAHSGTASSGRNNNPKNVGICLLGDFEVTSPSPAALATLDRMVAEIRTHYRLPASAIKPHSYWKDTLCPGRNMTPWLRRQS